MNPCQQYRSAVKTVRARTTYETGHPQVVQTLRRASMLRVELAIIAAAFVATCVRRVMGGDGDRVLLAAVVDDWAAAVASEDCLASASLKGEMSWRLFGGRTRLAQSF